VHRHFGYDSAMQEHDTEAPLSTWLRIGMACALIGIAVGAVLAWQHLDNWVHIFRLETNGYGHFMLPSLLLGGGAIACAVSEIVRTGRYRASLGVFALGLASMVTPVFFGIAIAVLIGVAVIGALLSANS
jgi:hypothetical protein